jgi:hypothetical protein
MDANLWRIYGVAKTRSHESGSLPNLVENLVKNWEIEASFKTDPQDFRTVHPSEYRFFVNGKESQAAQNMTEIGTYNALIAPNEYYSPNHCSYDQSHMIFKRTMPTFAWEVLEVYKERGDLWEAVLPFGFVVLFQWRQRPEIPKKY